jgi:general secretion pathway protein A
LCKPECGRAKGRSLDPQFWGATLNVLMKFPRRRWTLDSRYFGLARAPFENASGFQSFYINDSYSEAFDALHYGIELRLGLVVMTGESGVGKSSLVTLFRDSVKKDVRLVVLSARSERPADLLFHIVAGLGLDAPADRRAGIQTLRKYLVEQSKARQIVAIIIDDAEELTLEDFAVLRTLLSLRADGIHLLQIVLVGSPALASPDFPGLKSLRQRVRVWSQIPPLASHEVEAYIEHKLSFAGSPRGLFSAGAVAWIAAYSHGIPKTIDALCDRSLRLAYLGATASGKRRIRSAVLQRILPWLFSQDPISEPIVKDASKVLHGDSEPNIEVSPSSGDLASRSSSEAYAEAPKTWHGTITENLFSPEPKSRTGRRATALATACVSWIPQASQRFKSLLLSTPIRECGRPLATGAIVIAGLAAAAVISLPTFDPPPQSEIVQKANGDTEAQPAPLVSANEESALQTEQVQTSATAIGDTAVSSDDHAPQLQMRTVERPGELVYLHTSQRDDFPALEDIGAVLRNEGYVVRDTRFTRNSTQGDVRFFFSGDRRAAERVKSVLEAQLQSRGYPRRLQLLERDGRKFRFAAPGKIEVWLPPLTRSDRG